MKASNIPTDTHDISRIGVIGVGTMGQGIAQVAAQAGLQVVLFDSCSDASPKAAQAIARNWESLVAKGKLLAEARDRCMVNLQCASSLAELAQCDLVVEAIVEDISAKQSLFLQLEDLLRPDAILATNTSSLSVTAVASVCKRPERVVGWHFFNPVPLMRIAEVVRGELTDNAVAQQLMALTVALGHKPVLALDMPGFIVNHAGRAYIPEGLRLLSEGIADHDQIDRVMRDVAGFRMGPFELLDLIGIDVGQKVMESLYHQYYEEPRFKITPLVARKVAAGLLGRKSGEGFYRYVQGKTIHPEEPALTPLKRMPVSLWISPHEPDLAQRVQKHVATSSIDGLILETGPLPTNQALIVVTPVGEDTSTTCVAQGLDPQRTVAIDALFPFEKRCALMASPVLLPDYRAAASILFTSTGSAVTWLRDSPGFIAQRIVAQIVSIGADMAQHRIATPGDIDLAVTLALGYPQGPFGMAQTLGVNRVLQISEALYHAYGDTRYRPSIWLRRRAQLGLPLSTLD